MDWLLIPVAATGFALAWYAEADVLGLWTELMAILIGVGRVTGYTCVLLFVIQLLQRRK